MAGDDDNADGLSGSDVARKDASAGQVVRSAAEASFVSAAVRDATVPQSPAFGPLMPADEGAEAAEGEEVVLAYNRDELRRAVARNFTAGELSRFAKQFKVFTDRDGSVAASASQLVRALDARGRLVDLGAALMRDKPEVAWPQPTRRLVAAGAPKPAQPKRAGELADPFAPTPFVPAPIVPNPGVKSARPPTAASAAAVPLAAVGTNPSVQPAAAPLDSRRLMIIAALVFGGGLAIGIGATALSVARTPPPPDSGTPNNSGPVALALLAADELGASVTYVSEACDMNDSFPSARERLAESFRRCGIIEIPTRDGLTSSPSPRPSATPPAPPSPRPRERPIRISRPSAGAGCLDKCHRGHEQCKKTECGPEPTSASDYTQYQQCTSRCVARYSRCRLSCR